VVAQKGEEVYSKYWMAKSEPEKFNVMGNYGGWRAAKKKWGIG